MTDRSVSRSQWIIFIWCGSSITRMPLSWRRHLRVWPLAQNSHSLNRSTDRFNSWRAIIDTLAKKDLGDALGWKEYLKLSCFCFQVSEKKIKACFVTQILPCFLCRAEGCFLLTVNKSNRHIKRYLWLRVPNEKWHFFLFFVSKYGQHLWLVLKRQLGKLQLSGWNFWNFMLLFAILRFKTGH